MIIEILAICFWAMLALSLLIEAYQRSKKQCPKCNRIGSMEYNKLTTATQGEWRKRCTECNAVWYRDGSKGDKDISDISMYHRK